MLGLTPGQKTLPFPLPFKALLFFILQKEAAQQKSQSQLKLSHLCLP